MAKQLTKEARTFVLHNSEAYKQLADFIGILPVSLPMLINRNNHKVNRYDVVEKIAQMMGKKPSDIQEEAKPKAKKLQVAQVEETEKKRGRMAADKSIER